FVLQVAQLVRPTALVRYGGPQPAQALGQTGVTVGDDQLQKLSAQAATPQAPQEPIPSVLGLGFDDLEVNQLALSLPRQAIGTERHPPLNRAHQPNPHTDRI